MLTTMSDRPIVCLVMNAKVDPPTIERALNSVNGIVDHYVISTTPGDTLEQYIQQYLHCMRKYGMTFTFERENGGQMRTRLFEEAAIYGKRHGVTHFLNLDADDEIAVDPGFSWDFVHHFPVWSIHEHADGFTWDFPRIFSTAHEWRWKYPLHEIPVSDTFDQKDVARAPKLRYVRHHDDTRGPGYYQVHADIIERWMAESEENASDPRMTFYMAQSLEAAGKSDDAAMWYDCRAKMTTGLKDEAWLASYRAAKLRAMKANVEPTPEKVKPVIDELVSVGNADGRRCEPFVIAAQLARFAGRHDVALGLAEHALRMPFPTALPHLDMLAWEYGRDGEYLSACFHTGQFPQALTTVERMLASGKVPESEVERLTMAAAALKDMIAGKAP
jgi:hypothetical protein